MRRALSMRPAAGTHAYLHMHTTPRHATHAHTHTHAHKHTHTTHTQRNRAVSCAGQELRGAGCRAAGFRGDGGLRQVEERELGLDAVIARLSSQESSAVNP